MDESKTKLALDTARTVLQWTQVVVEGEPAATKLGDLSKAINTALDRIKDVFPDNPKWPKGIYRVKNTRTGKYYAADLPDPYVDRWYLSRLVEPCTSDELENITYLGPIDAT